MPEAQFLHSFNQIRLREIYHRHKTWQVDINLEMDQFRNRSANYSSLVRSCLLELYRGFHWKSSICTRSNISFTEVKHSIWSHFGLKLFRDIGSRSYFKVISKLFRVIVGFKFRTFSTGFFLQHEMYKIKKNYFPKKVSKCGI